MYRGSLIVTALLIAIYCFTVLIRQVLVCKKIEYEQFLPKLSLLFLVKNQQDIIEGLIRELYTETRVQQADVIVIDIGSFDQTRPILERLTSDYPDLRFLAATEEHGILRKMDNFCRGQTVYCFDLTGSLSYNLMSKNIRSILDGSRSSLYRTRVLYKNGTVGRCNHNNLMIK